MNRRDLIEMYSLESILL